MSTLLGQVALGTVFQINENGAPVNYSIAKQNFNGLNLTCVKRQNYVTTGSWTSGDALVNYPSSTLNYYLNNTYLSTIDTSVRSLVQTITIEYGAMRGRTESFSTKVFSRSSIDGIDNADATCNGMYWGRDTSSSATGYAIQFNTNGSGHGTGAHKVNRSAGYLPFFCLSSDSAYISDSGALLVPPATPSIQSLSLIAMQGQPISISWNAVANATEYKLERKADTDSDWTQVYNGLNLEYSETVGAWNSVQYRISAFNQDVQSGFNESEARTVIASSSLAISGEDGSLGTIDSDVHYSITSDTGNQITLTRLVNNVQVYTGQVNSGFTYDIPIVELPTGEGTIVINASVQTAGGLVSQSRTWTYTKTAMTFSTVGGISELDQNNQAVWPKTVMEAIRTYQFMGGTLDKTLMTLANAVIRDPDTGAFVDFEGQGIDAPQILVGSYVGTGGNTVTINTPFEPIAIFIYVLGGVPKSSTYGIFLCSIQNGTSINAQDSLSYGIPGGVVDSFNFASNNTDPSFGTKNVQFETDKIVLRTKGNLTYTIPNENGLTYVYLIFGGSKTN